MLRRTSKAVVLVAALAAVLLPAPQAEAQSILRVVPRVVRGVGRALFGPWDRYYYASGYTYQQARYYVPAYWRYARPRWLVNEPTGPLGFYAAEQETASAVEEAESESEFRLASQPARSVRLSGAAEAFAGQLPENAAGILVSLPLDATLYVNETKSSLTGSLRKVFSRNLQPGKRYPYELRIEAMRKGKLVRQTKRVELTVGATEMVIFADEVEEPVIVSDEPSQRPTTLVVYVPSDAKVFLLGNETEGSGPVRRFSTTRLPIGQRTAYTLRVSVRRGNRIISQERKFILEGGRTQEQHFEFFGVSPSEDRVADGDETPIRDPSPFIMTGGARSKDEG